MKKLSALTLMLFSFSTAADSFYQDLDKKCAPEALNLPQQAREEARDFAMFTTLRDGSEIIPYRLKGLASKYDTDADQRPAHPSMARLNTHQVDCLRSAIEEKLGPYAKKKEVLDELIAYRNHLYNQERQGRSESIDLCKKEGLSPVARDRCWTDHFSKRLHAMSMRRVLLEVLRKIEERKFEQDKTVADLFNGLKNDYLRQAGTNSNIEFAAYQEKDAAK